MRTAALSRLEMRAKAERRIDEQKPSLLIGTPMCTPWSAWQHLNDKRRPPEVVMSEKDAGRLHLRWMCRLYRKQHFRGGYFLHEHPAQATGWQEPCLQEVLALSGVRRITADQCRHGQQTEQGEPVRKPTGFMSNCPYVLARLDHRCVGRNGYCSRPSGGVQS